jgi:myo-inositol-1(or 4)-monophosphatase
MNPSTNLLIEATRKASRFLQRDFMELEMLQNSSRGTEAFSNQAFIRTKNILKEDLSVNFSNIIFSDEPNEDIAKTNNLKQNLLLVTPIEGMANFKKGLQFFATSISLTQKTSEGILPISTVINFPALGEIYYAEKGGGCWLERLGTGFGSKAIRLRTSSQSIIEESLIAVSNDLPLLNLSKNIRVFGSACYSTAALFASGKADLLYYSTIPPLLKESLSLFVKESGGSLLEINGSFAAANYNLIDKFKQFLTK